MADEPRVVKYVPDWKTPCGNCGQKPTVTARDPKTNELVNHWEMCGPCVWGEAKTIDPEEW